MSKQVRIKRLALSNFKGLRNVAVEFDDNVTTVSGRNGTGKTTIKDAFNWLLWGKDSEGNSDSNFGIKTTDESGNFIPDLEHEVTGTFEVVDTATGEVQSVELRRSLVEEWKVPAGKTERQLKGHHTDYFCNGVPLKTKKEYDAKVSAMIPEDVFKVITDPYNFLSLHWKAQREILLQIAGEVSEADVAKGNEKFAALLANLTDKTLDEYKREVAVQKAKINEQLNKIPTAIDAITRVTPAAPDYDALQDEKYKLEADLKQVDDAQASVAEANRIAYEVAADTQRNINEKRSAQQKLLFDATENARKAAFANNVEYHNAERKLDVAKGDIQNENVRYNAERNRIQADQKRAEAVKADYIAKQEDLRKKWFEVNGEQFQQDPRGLICPLYGTVCQDKTAGERYVANQAEAFNKFQANKGERLAKITGEGKSLGEQVAKQDELINGLSAQLSELDGKHAQAVAQLEATYNENYEKLQNTSKADENPVIDPETLPEWVTLKAEIEKLTALLPTATQGVNSNIEELRQRRSGLLTKLDDVKKKLNVRDTIETNEKRIAELQAEAKTLAQEKARLQTEESVIDEFTTAQMNEVERRVNALFSRVQFKMYRTQIEDAKQVPDCVAYIDGVPFKDKNTAGKINAGLDVINTLCSFHEVTAPIFVDNAESVNEFIPVGSQLIKLVVSTGDFEVNNF